MPTRVQNSFIVLNIKESKHNVIMVILGHIASQAASQNRHLEEIKVLL